MQWLQRVQGGSRMQGMSVPAGLHVVYEDTDLACITKPQGMPVAVMILHLAGMSLCLRCSDLRPSFRSLNAAILKKQFLHEG